MIPQSQPKKKKNSSKMNLIISAVFHGILVGVLFYFAAKEGLLGKKIKTITAEMVHEKKPEPPKPKPEPPKPEPPKIVEPPKVVAPPAETVKAPPPAEVPGFDFEGGKAVNSESDPVQLYKGFMQYVLTQKWNRPDNMADDNFAAEVSVDVDKQGNLSHSQWLKGSGDPKWDASVKDVFKAVSNIGRPPPTNFPPNVTIRFDVQEETEPVMTQ